MGVVAHKDSDDDEDDDERGDDAECTLSRPPQLAHAPPAVQACVQAYHEQLAAHQSQVAAHLASMRSVQKRMFIDIARLAAEPAELDALSVEVDEQRQQPASSPRQINHQLSPRAASNLPVTAFSSGDLSDLHTQNVLFSPGGRGRGATSPRGLMQSTHAMPPALDPVIETRASSQDQRASQPPVIGSRSSQGSDWNSAASARGASAELSGRTTMDAATKALDSLTSKARVKRFLTRFKSQAMGNDEAQ